MQPSKQMQIHKICLISKGCLKELFHLHKAVSLFQFCLVLYHVDVSDKQTTGVDATVWAVIFSFSNFWLVGHREYMK
jgi:hypothetical protein